LGKEWRSVQRRRLVWELKLKKDYPALAPVAVVLLCQHATACSVERAWSCLGNISKAALWMQGVSDSESSDDSSDEE
jgi:hypothetical protein